MKDTDTYTRRITVYRDSPLWAKYDRWFKLPIDALNELYVARYEVTRKGEWITEHELGQAATQIQAEYPDCILVY